MSVKTVARLSHGITEFGLRCWSYYDWKKTAMYTDGSLITSLTLSNEYGILKLE